MRSLQRLVVVGATIVLLAALVPAVSAASPRSGELHVTKECSAYTHLAGGYCTITSSNIPAIEVGTRVVYLQPLVGTVLETDVMLEAPGSAINVAFGHVHLDLVAKVGVVTLSGGTGTFSGIQATANVSYLGGLNWAWDGTYSFSPAPKEFTLTKTCVSNFLCTVQTSSFDAIPALTDITYLSGADPMLVYPTITVRNGSTTGLCNWYQPGPVVLAKCSFGSGTGRLASFNLEVAVSVVGDVWHWDGTYSFGGGG